MREPGKIWVGGGGGGGGWVGGYAVLLIYLSVTLKDFSGMDTRIHS